jgi:hypothetical protein
MKKIIFNMILLSAFISCFAQINVNETDKKRAEESDVTHFFICMTSNEYYEKVAKNNYYIFDTIGGYLYYGKVNSGFFRGKITEIFRIKIENIQEQLPNFRKLNGAELRKIVVSDIAKANKVSNKSEITIQNISYQLDDAITVFIVFWISGKEQLKTYKLNKTDFSIIK